MGHTVQHLHQYLGLQRSYPDILYWRDCGPILGTADSSYGAYLAAILVVLRRLAGTALEAPLQLSEVRIPHEPAYDCDQSFGWLVPIALLGHAWHEFGGYRSVGLVYMSQTYLPQRTVMSTVFTSTGALLQLLQGSSASQGLLGYTGATIWQQPGRIGRGWRTFFRVEYYASRYSDR